jgi:hypothetical protein
MLVGFADTFEMDGGVVSGGGGGVSVGGGGSVRVGGGGGAGFTTMVTCLRVVPPQPVAVNV